MTATTEERSFIHGFASVTMSLAPTKSQLCVAFYDSLLGKEHGIVLSDRSLWVQTFYSFRRLVLMFRQKFQFFGELSSEILICSKKCPIKKDLY